jgi:hypothetical protein
LLASVRHDEDFHSIRDLVQPYDREVREVAQVLVQSDNFVEACQEFVHSFTTYQKEIGDYWTTPGELLEARAGDCITGDTPVWLRCGGDLRLVEIRELLPLGNYAQFAGVEILTPSGFSPIVSVRRKPSRQTTRLLTTSDIGFTPEHKLLVRPSFHNNGRYCEASKIKLNDIIKVYPSSLHTDDGKGSDWEYEIGWAYGLFFSDGSSSIRKIHTLGGESWRVVNYHVDSLERAATTFGKLYPEMIFPIRLFSSYTKGSQVTSSKFIGQRGQDLYCMDALLKEDSQKGIRARFVRNFRNQLYNSLGVKKVPDFVLNGGKMMARGFWDGAYAGDGEQDGYRLSSHPKLGTFGLAFILHKIGEVPYVAKDHGGTRIHKALDRKQERRNWRFDGSEQQVYDIATETGEFVAGDIAVKNCDDKAILLTSLLRNYIPAEKVFCAFGKWGRNGKADGHMWVIMESNGPEDRVVEATASPDQPLYGHYTLEALFNDKYAFSYPAGIKDFNLLPVVGERVLA